MDIDIAKVKKLIKLLEESEISEIEIQEGEKSVRISRQMMQGGAHAAPQVFEHYPAPHSPTTQAHAFETKAANALSMSAQQASAVDSVVSQNKTTSNPNDHTITAPMVGTFYRSPTPNDKPFVEIGKPIKVGDVLCIVEAMKMLNQIEAEVAGVIKQILVENGQPIEFGQALFVLSKSE